MKEAERLSQGPGGVAKLMAKGLDLRFATTDGEKEASAKSRNFQTSWLFSVQAI
jgi:hypothetical protein